MTFASLIFGHPSANVFLAMREHDVYSSHISKSDIVRKMMI